jgi:hypothetical protein
MDQYLADLMQALEQDEGGSSAAEREPPGSSCGPWTASSTTPDRDLLTLG